MSSRRLDDFNPAGEYLDELRARGLVRTKAPAAKATAVARVDSIRKVLEAATSEPLPLAQVRKTAGLDATDFIATVDVLSKRDLVRIVDGDDGIEVKITADGKAQLES